MFPVHLYVVYICLHVGFDCFMSTMCSPAANFSVGHCVDFGVGHAQFALLMLFLVNVDTLPS